MSDDLYYLPACHAEAVQRRIVQLSDAVVVYEDRRPAHDRASGQFQTRAFATRRLFEDGTVRIAGDASDE